MYQYIKAVLRIRYLFLFFLDPDPYQNDTDPHPQHCLNLSALSFMPDTNPSFGFGTTEQDSYKSILSLSALSFMLDLNLSIAVLQIWIILIRIPIQNVKISNPGKNDTDTDPGKRIKGAVSWDFFHESNPSGPLINKLKCFFLKIRFPKDIWI